MSRRVEVSSSPDRERDINAAAAVDGIVDCSDASHTESELKRREPGMSTIPTGFSNSFDPYGAVSTPLYQTSTFEQVTYGLTYHSEKLAITFGLRIDIPQEAEVVAMTTVGGEIKLEYTPTWIVAGVCTVMVLISLIVERVLHFVGKKKNQKPLYEALLKVKEELMLMGFILLMLVAFQGLIQRICIPKRITRNMLPCNDDDRAIYNSTVTGGAKRRLLAGGSGNSTYCQNKGKVPLLSLEAINQIHIFIFVIVIVHMVLSLFIMVLGGAKIRQWKRWEEEIKKSGSNK